MFKKKIVVWVVLSMFLVGAGAGQVYSSPYRDLSPKEVSVKIEKKEDMVLLDVRTNEEYSKGHLAGAVHIPVDELGNRLSEINKFIDKEVIVYCHSGKRSLRASELLVKKGYLKVINMTGGIKEWIDSGRKVTLE